MQPQDNSYEEFLTSVEPLGLNLKSCSASLDRKSFWDLHEKKNKDAERQLFARYSIEKVEDDYFDVVTAFKMIIEDAKTKKNALRIECEFGGHFHGKAPIKESFAKRFTESELRIVVWPYFRQFVSDTTARMGIPPIVIPISIRGEERSMKTRSHKKKS